MLNLCVYGMPPLSVYKGVEEGRGKPSLWRALGIPTPTRSRIPPFHVVGVGVKEKESSYRTRFASKCRRHAQGRSLTGPAHRAVPMVRKESKKGKGDAMGTGTRTCDLQVRSGCSQPLHLTSIACSKQTSTFNNLAQPYN